MHRLPMSLRAFLLAFSIVSSTIGHNANAGPGKFSEQPSLGKDSSRQPDVPEGKMIEFTLADSKIFPGFWHKWWLYLPAQLNDKPMPVMVFLDGESYAKRDGHWRAPIVLDNLIARDELPAMAALFVNPGVSIAKEKDGRPVFNNRTVEYDTLNGDNADFLLNELLPEARKHVRITDNPEGRGVAGCSSGGIGAFTVAWQRPERFRKVLSFSGSFINFRGGDTYPDVVLKEIRKPIRIFQQAGRNDIVVAGLVPILEANELMSSALEQKHYDHKFVLDEGAHCSIQAAANLPNAMRWLWRDYPR